MIRPQVAVDPAAVSARQALRLTRGISVTWWYTFAAMVFFEAMLILVWMTALRVYDFSDAVLVAVGAGGVLWLASTVVLLLDYRHRSEATPFAHWRRTITPLLVAVAYGAVIGVMSGIWVLGFLPVVQSIVLLNWPQGLRFRVVVAVTLVLAGLWIVDARVAFAERGAFSEEGSAWFLSLYSVLLPAMTVMSLWWWDVLVTLDRARASEARLAATQERLRVATDVHDLQGHHLQVIALQLELAERLMESDPAAALEQLRAGRTSVDEARQGTRDLALRFRSVPLRDELANAADLMRAADITVDVTVDADADRSPGDALGPVIRETTTNVLRHGGGRWARLSLVRDGSWWRYEISNDAVADDESAHRGGGSGLDGLERRAHEVGGTIEVLRTDDAFSVVMRVPAEPGVSR